MGAIYGSWLLWINKCVNAAIYFLAAVEKHNKGTNSKIGLALVDININIDPNMEDRHESYDPMGSKSFSFENINSALLQITNYFNLPLIHPSVLLHSDVHS